MVKALKPVKGAKRYEGSGADNKHDRMEAKKHGESLKAWERSAADQRFDNAGQKALNAKAKAKAKRKGK